MATKGPTVRERVSASEYTGSSDEDDTHCSEHVYASAAKVNHKPKRKTVTPSMFQSRQQKKARVHDDSDGLWITHERSLLVRKNGIASASIAAFDLDHTVIRPKSGRVHPKNEHDWEWWHGTVPQKLRKLVDEGKKLVFVSNQSRCVGGKRTMFVAKIEAIVSSLGCPVQVFVATDDDWFRKPYPLIWQVLEEHFNNGLQIDRASSVYVGDAAGRCAAWDGKASTKKDFAASDRLFAHNVGVPFATPEEYFLGDAPPYPTKWSMPLPTSEPTSTDSTFGQRPHQELVLCVGYPASGKSTFVKQHFDLTKTVYINQDEFGTKARCLRMAKEALERGSSVVVDNTNPSAATRAEYIAIAGKLSTPIPVRCLWFDTDPQICKQMNEHREVQTGKRVPTIAFNMFKSKFEAPNVNQERGLTEVNQVTIQWNFVKENNAMN